MVKKAKKKKASRPRSNGGAKSGLSALGRNWKNTVAKTGGGGFPLGKGQEGIIRAITIEQSQNHNWQVIWVLEGTSAGIEGRKHYKRSMIETEENRGYLRGEMETIGLTWPDTIEELGNALDPAENLPVSFDVVPGKDEFVNLYFNEALEGNGGSTPEPADSGSYTREEIIQLGKDEDEAELIALGKEEGLKEGDYDTWPAFAEAIADEKGL